MNQNRRKILKALGGAGAIAAAEPYLSFPAIAQSRTLKIGIIAPKAGIVGTIGECGLRGTLFAVDRINALPQRPAFVLHTGDLTHLAKPAEFDTVAEVLKGIKADKVLYVPGEHDVFTDDGKLYLEHTLSAPVSGRIGLWSKADSYMHFSDYTVSLAN